MDTEKEFADSVIKRLSKYFDAKAECWSECGKNRIDWILTDKQNKKPFGIEFKTLENKRGEEIGEHILQSMRYACSKFFVNNSWQRIPILICPPISFIYLQAPDVRSRKNDAGIYGRDAEYYHDRHDRYSPHHTINGMLGALGLGEVRTTIIQDYRSKKEVQYVRFIFSNKILWDESPEYRTNTIKGIHQINYEFQISKPITYNVK